MPVHVLIGGTGTLGRALFELLARDEANSIRVLARGEHRLNEMRERYKQTRFSFITCDVRDRDRLTRALRNADYIYHLAALKHVHTCEYDVIEAVRTNIEGTYNVINACIDANVKKVVLVSTDKAVEPTTTYGATKLVAERLFIHGNNYVGRAESPVFFCVRYGNVLGSQGSVLTKWREQAKKGKLSVVDPNMTRFWWSVNEAAKFVLQSMYIARKGDILVPILSSCSLKELAEIIAPDAEIEPIDGHVYEKQHEILLSSNELSLATYVNTRMIRVSCFLKSPSDEPVCSDLLDSSTSVNSNEVIKCHSGR